MANQTGIRVMTSHMEHTAFTKSFDLVVGYYSLELLIQFRKGKLKASGLVSKVGVGFGFTVSLGWSGYIKSD